MAGKAADGLDVAPRSVDVLGAAVVLDVGDQPGGFLIGFAVRGRHEIEEIDRLNAERVAKPIHVNSDQSRELNERRGVGHGTRNGDRRSDFRKCHRGDSGAVRRDLQAFDGNPRKPRYHSLTGQMVCSVGFVVGRVRQLQNHRRASSALPERREHQPLYRVRSLVRTPLV